MTFDPDRTGVPTPPDLTPPPPPYPRTSPSPSRYGGGDQPSLSPDQIRDLFPLTPTTPSALALVQAFKEVIGRHMADVEGKTTEDFIEALALELWTTTRRLK